MTLFLKSTDIFHWYGLLLDDLGELLWLDVHGTSHQLWHVIALQELAVIVGVGTRKFERLSSSSIVVDMCDERARVVAIIAPAAEDHPFAVARP